MTEIPEHLLKRSRAAKGKDEPSGDAGADSGASTAAVTPAASAESVPAGPPALAAAAAAIPADGPAPAPAPEPHFVTAARSRKKMPMWAMFMLAFVPLWAVSFGGTMQLPDVEDPLFTEAAELYNVTGGCSGCHGAGGGGTSVGYQLSDGSVIETFPHFADQMVHVYRGSGAITGQAYGAARADGQRIAGSRGVMPAATTLSQIELELVIFHERVVLSGEEVGDEYVDHLRERLEAGEGAGSVGEEYFDLLLSCSDPAITPEATGGGAVDGSGEDICPGPHLEAP